MNINKAVITIASKEQRNLPLQTLIDRDGLEKSVLQILIEETIRGGVEEIGLVIAPGDQNLYSNILGDHASRITFIEQTEPLGYGHAVYSAKDFIDKDPFLHLVGDHLYISKAQNGCVDSVIKTAVSKNCSISTVQPTRENLIQYFGAVGGQRIPNEKNLYRIDSVVEKPTPTEAEENLIMSGLRAGYYLCFFGIHVFTPTIMDILFHRIKISESSRKISLSEALTELARVEQYIAMEKSDFRYDIGVKYGLLTAQIALGLNGKDKDEVLALLLNLFVENQMSGTSKGK